MLISKNSHHHHHLHHHGGITKPSSLQQTWYQVEKVSPYTWKQKEISIGGCLQHISFLLHQDQNPPRYH